MKIFQNLNFVLVETSHPGNIGACARAMNSMGICNLSLVNPKEFPSKESEARAKSGRKVLDQANIHDNLNEAINTSNLVIGTSARSRSMPWPMMEINNLGKVINESLARNEKVSIVFGNEAVGLDNEDLGKCDFHLQIPTSEDSSLNLSHAVAIISYNVFELRNLKKSKNKIEKNNQVNKNQLSKYFDYLFDNLSSKNFFVPEEKTDSMKNNIYNIYLKSSLTKKELQTLWGITKKLTK